MPRIQSLLLAVLFLVGIAACSSTDEQPVEVVQVDDTSTVELEVRFNSYNFELLASGKRNPKLGAELEVIRQSPGWMAFEKALAAGDRAVNAIADEPMLKMDTSEQVLSLVAEARDAWRHAASFGIEPPSLSRGHAEFTSSSLKFHIHAASASRAVLIVRSSRGQVLGIFDLKLADNGLRQVATHMMQSAFSDAGTYLNDPWRIVMQGDSIDVKDVRASIDRMSGKILLQ